MTADDPPDPLLTPAVIEDTLSRSNDGRIIPARLHGATKPAKLVFSNGVSAVLKMPDPSGSRPLELDERMAMNEAAVYALARFLRLEIVPITVLRHFPRAQGGTAACSIQHFIDGAVEPAGRDDLESVAPEVLSVAAAFDHLVAQVDRIGRNWLLIDNLDGSRGLRLIDHGLCLDVPHWAPIVGASHLMHPDYLRDDGPRSDIIDFAQERGITPAWSILEPLRGVDLDGIVGAFLMPDQIAGLRRRIGDLLSDEQIG